MPRWPSARGPRWVCSSAARHNSPIPVSSPSRQPDHGFSRKGDGTDYAPSWGGQTPMEAYYLSTLLPGAPQSGQGDPDELPQHPE